MKKIITLVSMLFIAVSLLNAQPAGFTDRHDGTMVSPEERAERMARGMADQLALSDETAAKFVPVYKAFFTEQMAINKAYRSERKSEGESYSDAEVDAMLRKDFEKSQKLLDLRVAYYDKFLAVISPKQIRSLYQKEKEFGHGGGPRQMHGGQRPEQMRPGQKPGQMHAGQRPEQAPAATKGGKR